MQMLSHRDEIISHPCLYHQGDTGRFFHDAFGVIWSFIVGVPQTMTSPQRTSNWMITWGPAVDPGQPQIPDKLGIHTATPLRAEALMFYGVSWLRLAGWVVRNSFFLVARKE